MADTGHRLIEKADTGHITRDDLSLLAAILHGALQLAPLSDEEQIAAIEASSLSGWADLSHEERNHWLHVAVTAIEFVTDARVSRELLS